MATRSVSQLRFSKMHRTYGLGLLERIMLLIDFPAFRLLPPAHPFLALCINSICSCN